LKNILKNITSNSLILGIIGSVIGTLLILYTPTLVRFFFKLLFSWSNIFSNLIIDSTIKAAVREFKFIGYYTFLLVMITFGLVYLSLTKLEYSYLHSIKKQPDAIKRTIMLVYMLLAILIIASAANAISVEGIIVTQKLRIDIIAPYINEQIEEELWSKWYLISSKIDYIDYNNELDIIAENNNIELPKPYY